MAERYSYKVDVDGSIPSGSTRLMEPVVLVDEQNNVLGTAPKEEVHTAKTPLHRGFSLFLFNGRGELLLTRRALSKKTFPGVWTNTVCGHPTLNETPVAAAKRRLRDELGIDTAEVREVSPYRYRFADTSGIVENEICPILVGQSEAQVKSNPAEVGEWKWINWEDFLADIGKNAPIYSPWSIEEARVLEKLNLFHA